MESKEIKAIKNHFGLNWSQVAALSGYSAQHLQNVSCSNAPLSKRLSRTMAELNFKLCLFAEAERISREIKRLKNQVFEMIASL